MATLAQILEWKFPNTEGIQTKENLTTGEMEIFDWPEVLGSEPTTQQIAAWEAEFDALPPPADPDEELLAAIQAATNLQELKDALLGLAGKAGRVRGREI